MQPPHLSCSRHAYTQPEWGAGGAATTLISSNIGSQVRGLNPKKTAAGTRPEGLSSTNMGSQVWSQPQEDGGGDKAGALSLNQYGVAGVFSVRGLNLKRTGTGTRREVLSSSNMGSQVRGVNPKRTDTGTRPERLSSSNMGSHMPISSTSMGSQVWSHPEEDGGGDKAEGLEVQPPRLSRT